MLLLLLAILPNWAGLPLASSQTMTTKNKSVAPAKVEVPRTGDVEVQTKLEVLQENFVLDRGRAIIKATGELATKYFDLVVGIRQQKIAPKLVSFALGKLGFKRSRVSEINRVANASDKLFKDYEAKLLGFDKILELARAEKDGGPMLLTDAAKELVKSGALSQDDVDGAIKAESDVLSAAASGVKAKKKGDGMKAQAEKLLEAAAKVGRPKYVYCFKAYPYRMTIERLGKTGPAVGDDSEKD